MVDRAQAAAEILRRREARRSLLAYTEYTFPQYRTASPHKLIADGLEAVERGDIKRLMISVPPRGGKSELVSRRFPAWVLGRNPGVEIISATYSGEFAADFGREVRGIILDQEHVRVFPDCQIDPFNKSVDNWATTNKGKYRAIGVEGSATGRGSDFFIIDDPVKDRKEADSETTQKRTWDFYRAVAYTRLSANGRIIVCQTRWHDEDLSGKLEQLEKRGGDKWHKIIIPAIDADGASFWNERFPLERLAAIRMNSGQREWSALYMQRPQPEDGTFFRREWFDLNRYDEVPKSLNVYATSDHAQSDDKGDYTVFVVWGIDPKGDLYWLDSWRGRTTPDKWMMEVIPLIRRHKPLCWFAEGDAIFKAVEPFIRRQMIESKAMCRIEKLSTAGDKSAKAQSYQAMASLGRVHLPWTTPADEAIGEAISFPTGAHDDITDCGSNMARALMQSHPAIVQTKPKEPERDSWGYLRRDDENADWRSA